MIALVLAAAASAGEPETLSYGRGVSSCATMLQPVEESAKIDWLLGFWTGLNTAAGNKGNVGHSTDANGIIGEVDNLCREHPSYQYGLAAIITYVRFKKAGR